MKFGVMKTDVDVKKRTAKNFHGDYTRGALVREGKRLYKQFPEYSFLSADPWIEAGKTYDWCKDNNVFYWSVVYAYMVNCILDEHPELKEQYYKIVKKSIFHTKECKITYENGNYNGKEQYAYSNMNERFLQWYDDYLREQADPGVLERERKAWEQKQRDLQLEYESRERHKKWQEEEELANGTRVICPYCKSADTKKLTALNRAVSVSLVGAASGKIGKQWHCNHCGSDF